MTQSTDPDKTNHNGSNKSGSRSRNSDTNSTDSLAPDNRTRHSNNTDAQKPDTRTRHEKYRDLLEILRGLGKTAVAYSGGVDSTFLLAAAKEAPVQKLVAMTMKRPYIAQWELVEADEFIRKLGVEHHVVELPVDEEVRNNVVNRCYYCKSSTFGYFREQLQKMGFDTLVDGTNADDMQEFRPGLRAIRENGVRSPLQEAGLTKPDIRALSREMGLPDWDKPANTCLVTRIPYNTLVRDEDLRLIEKAEFYLMKQGFRQVRVRKHDDLARIEVEPAMVARLTEPGTASRITSHLKELGFRYVSMDLEGYKTGKMDQAILKNSK